MTQIFKSVYVRYVCIVQITFCTEIYLLEEWIFINTTFKEITPTPMLVHHRAAHFSKPGSYTAEDLHALNFIWQ